MMSSSEIETRLATLEAELLQLKMEVRMNSVKPWWENILGQFADDPVYDEAMQLGQEYRESLRNPQSIPNT
jgi:hypothetical protein